ncbi:Transcription factor GRAS [Dillenia turbinata]|uniref:Transcription factor GRAS n=1 Tax=Dillenia turbinata TaxID=194707 RepID=A0AAN8Z861_9MAGN
MQASINKIHMLMSPENVLEIPNQQCQLQKTIKLEDNVYLPVISDAAVEGQKLSIEEVMRVAGVMYIQSCAKSAEDTFIFSDPYFCSMFELCEEDKRNVELAQLLLASTEKVGCQQFMCAQKLLGFCFLLCSSTGNSVERVVHYFSEALKEKIDKETGRFTSKRSSGREEHPFCLNSNPMFTAYTLQRIPFFQVAQFAGVQEIVEQGDSSEKVHLIDLGIGSGVQWIDFMQASAANPMEITVRSATISKDTINNIGNRLVNFANTMNIPLSFKVVLVTNIRSIRKDQFDIDTEEVVAVYAASCLSTLVAKPESMDSLIEVIKSLRPQMMIFTEVEANLNSCDFVNHFIEAFFFYSVYFDCLETCMD